jgi:hypothetical protein
MHSLYSCFAAECINILIATPYKAILVNSSRLNINRYVRYGHSSLRSITLALILSSTSLTQYVSFQHTLL